MLNGRGGGVDAGSLTDDARISARFGGGGGGGFFRLTVSASTGDDTDGLEG